MNPVRLVISVAIVAAVGLRLYFRRRRRTGAGGSARSVQLPAWLGDVGLVAAREVRERVRSRMFRVVTVILLVVVTAAVVIPELTKSSSGPEHVGVVGTLSKPQRAAVLGAVRSQGSKVVLVPEPSRTAAESRLRSGRLDLAVVGGRTVLVDKHAATQDSTVQAVAAALGVERAFADAALSPKQALTVISAKPVPVTSLEAASPSRAIRGSAVTGIVLLFVMLSQYETWTLVGVMEEKSSRVVEVLLATVRPLQLLGGKLLGIGAVVLAQAAVVLGLALGLAKATGSDLLHGSAPSMLGACFLWLVVGYAFYSWVYAAAGSTAERQDQVQTLALPLSVPMIIGYISAVVTASSGHASLFFDVLAYLPPTAPFAMPVLVGLGTVPWWGFVLSVVLSLVATVGVARMAAAIYRRAVLRTGRRVRLRELLPGAPASGTAGPG